MKRPVLTAAAALSSLLTTAALAQTTRDYAAIYGARGGAAAPLSPQQEVATTVGTGPATRYAKPQPGSERRAPQPLPRGTGREFGYQDYGTVSGGYPTYGSREFPQQPTPPPAPVQAVEEEAPAQAQQQQPAEGEQNEEAFAVSEGFFFDNYTSGTGFGVYGGEAVSSGPGSPLILPSAGNRAQELGLTTGAGAPGRPQPGPGTGPGGEEPDPEG